jgi:hypothetical protein
MQAQKFSRIITLTGGDDPLALNGGIPPMGPPTSGQSRLPALSARMGSRSIQSRQVGCTPSRSTRIVARLSANGSLKIVLPAISANRKISRCWSPFLPHHLPVTSRDR